MAELWMDVDAALSEVPVNVMALIDDTDFKTREESVVYNQAGLDLLWNFTTTAGAFTQTAVTPTDTAGDYDWVNQGNGYYTIEIPASAGASINNDTEGFGFFSGFATGVLPWRGPVIGFRAAAINNALIDAAFDAVRGFGSPTALPDAAAEAAGGLATSAGGATGIDDLATPTNITAASGVALSATGLDAIAKTATGMVAAASAVWDRVLSGATHNIATSAGRRLRTLQDFGVYAMASVWVDEVGGQSSGTTAFEDGTVSNRSDDLDNAVTIAVGATVNIDRIHVQSGNNITLIAALAGYEVWGQNYTIQLGSQSVAGSSFQNAIISGIGTGATPIFIDCEITTATLPPCRITGGQFSAITMGSAGAFKMLGTKSGVAGAAAPTIDFGAAVGATTLEMRDHGGGITLSNLAAGDVVTIEGTLGTVTLGGADASVEIRGTYKALVNNLTGAPTVSVAGAILAADVAAILVDTNELQADWTNAGRLDAILDIIAADTTTDIPALIDAVKAKTDNLPTDPADQSLVIAATDANLAAIAALNDLSAANILTQVNTALDTAIAELGVGIPTATPTMRTGLMLLYMALRNLTGVNTTAAPDELQIHNDAGTKIASKALTDDGTDYAEAKMISG